MFCNVKRAFATNASIFIVIYTRFLAQNRGKFTLVNFFITTPLLYLSLRGKKYSKPLAFFSPISKRISSFNVLKIFDLHFFFFLSRAKTKIFNSIFSLNCTRFRLTSTTIEEEKNSVKKKICTNNSCIKGKSNYANFVPRKRLRRKKIEGKKKKEKNLPRSR